MIAYFTNNGRYFLALVVIVVAVPFAMGLWDFDSYNPSAEDLTKMNSYGLENPSNGAFGKGNKYKYYGEGEIIDIISVENHTSGAARSRVVYDIEYKVLEDLYMGNKDAEKESDLVFTKKYSKGETFIEREATLLGRDMDTFGSPKRPYEFRGIVPMKLTEDETIPEAQLLKDYRVSSTLIHRLLMPESFLRDMVAQDKLMASQIRN